MLQESYMMVPDSKSRLEKAVLDLANVLVRLVAYCTSFSKWIICVLFL